MSKLKLLILCCAAVCAVTQGLGAGAQDLLPEGAGVAVVRDKCVTCHEADLIVQQRLSRTGWTREVEKMMRWGSVVTDAEKETIVNYLTAQFGPRPLRGATTPSAAAAGSPDAGKAEAGKAEAGKAIFEAKCLLCHEADLTEQQRLSRAGWTREVEKMVRWGATVTDAEKEPLVDYLTNRYGPRKK
jgi:cytochrome c5